MEGSKFNLKGAGVGADQVETSLFTITPLSIGNVPTLTFFITSCIPGLSTREKILGSRLIANYVSRTVYINTEVSEIQYYT